MSPTHSSAAAASSSPLSFFQALHSAFTDTVQARQQQPALIDGLLAQAFDSFDGNVALQAEDEPPLDCGRGCAACCTLRVTATAPEVLLVARFLRAVQPALLQRGIDLIGQLRAADACTAVLDEAQRVQQRQRCPFIAQGVCVIYRVRPLACRGHASHDRHACAEAAAGRRAEVPYSQAHRLVRSLVQNALQSALRDAGQAWGLYELNHALLIAMDDPESEARWLAGEMVFAEAQVSEVSATEMAQVFDQLKAAPH
jgi:Fe-S-cluster containining protein